MATTNVRITHTEPHGGLNVSELKDGQLHRRVIQPGDDLSKEVEAVRLEAENVHTPEVIAAYKTAEAERNDSITIPT